MSGQTKRTRRTCLGCGGSYLGRRRKCDVCYYGYKGYKAETRALTEAVHAQPIRVRHERLQRLRAHAARIRGRVLA